MAAYGAKLAIRNALNGDAHRYDATAMPAVTFADPQVATVGLTKKEAREQGKDVKTSVLGLEHVPRALATRDIRGLMMPALVLFLRLDEFQRHAVAFADGQIFFPVAVLQPQ